MATLTGRRGSVDMSELTSLQTVVKEQQATITELRDNQTLHNAQLADWANNVETLEATITELTERIDEIVNGYEDQIAALKQAEPQEDKTE